MYLYEAPENGSNTILRGADKDSGPKYPIIMLVHCSPFSLTLTACMSQGLVFFFSYYFLLPFSQETKMCRAFSFHITFVTWFVLLFSFLDHFPSIFQLKGSWSFPFLFIILMCHFRSLIKIHET